MIIVKRGTKYAIKRWCFGWEYLGSLGTGWYANSQDANRYCLFNTLEDAIREFDSFKEIKVSKKEIEELRLKININTKD